MALFACNLDIGENNDIKFNQMNTKIKSRKNEHFKKKKKINEHYICLKAKRTRTQSS